MYNTKSISFGRSQQAPIQSKDTDVRRPTDARMIQNALLIWLDNNIDDRNEDCRNTITQLRRVVNTVHTFTNIQQCIDFFTELDNENVFMIISGELCRKVVPRIHTVPQLRSIFIFCENHTRYEQWAKEWSKIKGVFIEISSVCEALKRDLREIEQNAISVSFISKDDDAFNKNLDRLDPMFMYTQIIKEILLTIKFETEHVNECFDYCRDIFKDNIHTLKKIDEFQQNYRNKPPIWWYTRECYLYPMLNHALRVSNVDIIIKMGFIINAINRQIKSLHKEQFGTESTNKIFVVYRGQGLSKTDFEHMQKSKGGLISFNSFLSTSKDRAVAQTFAESNQSNPDLIGILFVMTIDLSKSTTAFASIDDISNFTDEGEILFSMHTVFRINDTKSMDKSNRLFQVDLLLTDDNDQDLNVLTDFVRSETFISYQGWHRLGSVLHKMGEYQKAQQIYETMLGQARNDSEKAVLYHHIGWAKGCQGEYKEALKYYERSIEIEENTIPRIYSNLAASYHNIGSVYAVMGEYTKALSYYEKDMELSEKSLSPNHPDLATSYMSLSTVYRHMNDYTKACKFSEKALRIQRESLPPNHPTLAMSYLNFGIIYDKMSDYSEALSFYQQALEIQQQILPPNHPHLATTYMNIGIVYAEMGDYTKALSSHEKALNIRQQSVSPNPLDIAASYSNISGVYYNMDKYSKALSFIQKAIEIQQQLLPANQPGLAKLYNNIGGIYVQMDKQAEAVSWYEKALEIQQQFLPLNHPEFAISYINIGNVYGRMGEYAKALSSFGKALKIQHQSLPSNHREFAVSYNNIGDMYHDMGEYSKSLSSYKKALEIEKQCLPADHPDLAQSYYDIRSVRNKMSKHGTNIQRH